MKISFFVEFPEKELEKLNLINFPAKLYIAAESTEELNKIKKQIKSKYIKKIIWWPILKKEEGYWFSPFASPKAMERILNQIKKQQTMIDLELPYYRKHIITRVYRLLTNRKILKKIIKQKNIISCEHFMENILTKLIGINQKTNNKIKMIYTSHLKLPRTLIENKIKNLSGKYPNLKIGLGLITHGVEEVRLSILTPQQLKEDIKLCKKYKIKEIIIYRLGGLNKNYIKTIQEFL